MIGFLIKKTLYDLWDNMFKIVVLNIGFLACTAAPVLLPGLAKGFFPLEIIFAAIGIFICSVYLAAAAFSIKSISDNGTFYLNDFLKSLKAAWPAGFVMGGFLFFIFLVVTIILPFYISMESPVIGLALAAIVFWITIFAILSFQFYFSVIVRLSPNLIKGIKKCMLISMDNTGLSVFLIIHNMIVLLLSVIFLLLFPGPVGVLIYIDQALRLRLLKYDWLEANPGANRRKIPWDELLIEEREKTGTRTFKNFIFPWKD